MDLKFSEMSVDTSLAQEYLNKNKALLELCNDYDGITKKNHPYVYYGKEFNKEGSLHSGANERIRNNILLNMARSLKQNANLIAQLEYLFRNIPIEVTNVQLKLLIQHFMCIAESEILAGYADLFVSHVHGESTFADDSLLSIGTQIGTNWIFDMNELKCTSKSTAAVCYLFVTLLHDAGFKDFHLVFESRDATESFNRLSKMFRVKGLDSGTVAVVSDDADVDSAVDKFISVSIKAPWRLRRILVQESVYQQFKDVLSWKCNFRKSGNEPLASDALCSDTLSYNDRTFLIDPVELTEESPSVVIVEAYRTTKEMISLVQQDKTRYLSLWTNGIAEINEVTQGTKAPVVWVNNVADFRGPAQVSEAVFSYTYSYTFYQVVKCDRFAKVCELLQSWQKLDLESRRDILCGVLDKYILLNPANKEYTETRNSLLTCSLKSFVDVGKDYVCVGMSQPVGILGYTTDTIFSVKSFKSLLQGNALNVLPEAEDVSSDYTLLEQAGVPVVRGESSASLIEYAKVIAWTSGLDTVTRVIWTNSGTIFAN